MRLAKLSSGFPGTNDTMANGNRERPLVTHLTPHNSGSVMANYSSVHISVSCGKRGGFLVQMTTRILMIVFPWRFTQRLSHLPCSGICNITATMGQSHPTASCRFLTDSTPRQYIIVTTYLTTASNYRLAEKSRTGKDVVGSGRGLVLHTSRDLIEND